MRLRVERLQKVTLASSLAVAILIGGFLALALPVAAVVTPGSTKALVNPGQLIRDGSTAVPIFGITATSNDSKDQLLSISVSFAGTGFTPGNTGTLLALNTNPALSGVALYEDVGTAPGALDAADVGVTATAAVWAGSQVVLNYTEQFPTVPAGAFVWILVIRTSSNAASLANGNQIIATIPAAGIVFSGAVAQPATALSANTLTVSLTSATNLIAPQAWIGPLAVRVNARAVLGIRIVDGGIPVNFGVNDALTEVIVHIIDINVTYTPTSLLAPNVNSALSGIGLYRDSNANGVWDPADTPVILSSISVNCVPPVDVEDWCLFPNAEPVPHTLTAGYSYFVVVRSNAMATGDDFQFEVDPSQIVASGVHPNDANRPTQLTPTTSGDLLGDDTPPCVTVVCGEPFEIHWANPTASPYLFPVNQLLYFSHGMGATRVPGQVVLSARDGESGLGLAVFTVAPSLAASPAPVALSGTGVDVTIRANYSFNATSTAASSPAFVTVYDAVGNNVTAPALSYVLDTTNSLVVPAPGWSNLPGPNFYVNGTGTLWFSPWIPGTQNVDIRVNLSDAISGLKTTTATSEPSLAGGPIYRSPTNLSGVGAFNGWTVSYAFNAASTDASSPATITACDEVANCGRMSFAYRLDSTPPTLSILGPTMGSVLSGRVVVAATGSDAGSGLSGVFQVEVLGQTGFMDMVWNGTAWDWPISTAAYPDGSHRIVVRALDNVGNEGVATVDVTFLNAVMLPPAVAFTAPDANALVSGVLDVRVSVTDAVAVTSVSLTFGTTTVTMARVGSGLYVYPLDTTSLTTGVVVLSVTATDIAGHATTQTLSIRVDNSGPTMALASPSSDHGAITLHATVSDSPAGVASVVFVVDGKTYTAVADGQGVYSVTIWTTTADNGVHSYEVIATDHAGNTATSSSSFTVNNPTDYYAATVTFAPLGIFVLLILALIVGLMLVRRRRKRPGEPPMAEPKATSKQEEPPAPPGEL